MAFQALPFDSKLPSFVTHDQVLQYLQAYATAMDVHKHVRLNTRVTNVRPVGSGERCQWEVATTSSNSSSSSSTGDSKKAANTATPEVFDFVCVANGHYAAPLCPDIPGLEAFSGLVQHSMHYRQPKPFTGKSVIIVGDGPSARDISMEISTVAASVKVSTRASRSLLVVTRLLHIRGASLVPPPATAHTSTHRATVWATCPHLCLAAVPVSCSLKRVSARRAMFCSGRRATGSSFPFWTPRCCLWRTTACRPCTSTCSTRHTPAWWCWACHCAWSPSPALSTRCSSWRPCGAARWSCHHWQPVVHTVPSMRPVWSRQASRCTTLT